MQYNNNIQFELSYESKVIITVLLLTLVYPAGVVSMYMWDIGPKWLKLVVLFPFLLLVPFFIDLMIRAF